MMEDPAPPQINMSKIVVGGGIAGALFAGGSMLIFLIGIPLIRLMFPAAILVGCGVAVVRHFTRHETSSTSRILLPRRNRQMWL
jgi:hypothetical protein